MLKNKIIKLLVGTNNKGKLREIKDLLPKNVEIYSPQDFKIKSPPENGKTFKENSLIKAKFFSKKSKMICLSDDSGLEIDVLDGDPGIYSARWAGKNKDFKLAIKKVYLKLKKKKKLNKNNNARFYCSLAIAFPNGEYKTFSGTVNGKISKEPKGNNGFGYDPIFIPNRHKKTFGEMKANLKDKISHRYKAFNKIKRYFKY